jgi:large repetitive protein
MTQAQVAGAVQLSLANRYSNGVLEAFKIDRNRIQIFGQTVVSPGPLGLTDSLPNDQFGSWTASTEFSGAISPNFPGALRAQNNNFEGVYIDDIIIGFAERGEMVTGTTGIRVSLRTRTCRASSIERSLKTCGRVSTGNPSRGRLRSRDRQPIPTLWLQQSFDTNERLAQGFTLVAPKASDIADGQTFRLSDGTNFGRLRVRGHHDRQWGRSGTHSRFRSIRSRPARRRAHGRFGNRDGSAYPRCHQQRSRPSRVINVPPDSPTDA